MTAMTLVPEDSDVASQPQPEAAPFLVEFFLVQALGIRCMAYRDADGQWRNAFTHAELFGEIQILK